MKRLLTILLLFALLPWSAGAQDARMRTTATIVADALAQLPAAKVKKYNEVMGELASTGSEGIVQLAGMLVPADKGKNATIEYALNGVVSFVADKEDNAMRAGVRQGLIAALEKCTDNPNKAFLMTLLNSCATAEDAPVYVKYLKDSYLADWAINGLITVDGTEATILDLMKNDGAPRDVLAYAAGLKKMKEAEPILLGWLKGADAATTTAIYKSLAECGSAASLPVLGAAAKAINYAWEGSSATDAYLILLNTMVQNGEGKLASAAAKKLIKATDKPNVRSAAMNIVFAANGKNAKGVLLAAMKDADREYRVAALRRAEAFADEAIYAALAKQLKGKNNTVKEDILNWFGSNKVASQGDAVIACMNDADAGVAASAIKAAAKIGGDNALNALIAQLNGKNADVAAKALLAFNGKVNPAIMQALDADKATQIQALGIAGKRHMLEATDKVFDLLASSDAEVSEAAYEALAGVSSKKDFDRLSVLLEKASGKQIPAVQKALNKTLITLSEADQYATVKPYVAKSSKVSLYYPVLAQVGNSDAIAEIMKGYKGAYKADAFASLLKVNNPEMIDVLYGIATSDKANAVAALTRYNQLVSKSGYTPMRKYQLYRKALEATDDAKVQVLLINSLAQVYTYPSLLLVEKYIDNPATAKRAAYAVRNIASKNTEGFGGAPVRKALEKAAAYLRTESDPDSGYAVDDITNMLTKLPELAYNPVFGVETWNPVGANPEEKAKLSSRKLRALEAAAATAAGKTWTVSDAGLKYAGGEAAGMAIGKNYENFEMLFEWKGNGTLGVRSIPAIALGGEKSGAVATNVKAKNTPEKLADNVAGEWNTAYVKVLNDRVTVWVNGVLTANNVILENTCNAAIPAYVEGQIQLIGQGEPMEVREMYIRELPSTPRFELSAEEAKEGFEVLFDGTSMHKWTGNTTDYVPVDGTIYVTAQYGGSGNLYTVKEYSDFIFRFEFCFLREGVNNGVGIRTPMGVDAAYEGMEIQILDHDAPIYRKLREYQQHGSVYGIIAAKRVKFPALGEWNTEEIRIQGDHITVTVNGEVILDGNIREACQGHNVSEDGSKKNPYTVDKKNHPGLFNKSGHIGFLGHGAGVKFRNIRIKDLSK